MNNIVKKRKAMMKEICDNDYDMDLLQDAILGRDLSEYIPIFQKFDIKHIRIGRFNEWRYLYSLFIDNDYEYPSLIRNLNPNTDIRNVRKAIENFCKEVVRVNESFVVLSVHKI